MSALRTFFLRNTEKLGTVLCKQSLIGDGSLQAECDFAISF